MLASIDTQSGTVERLVRGKGLTLETLERHPEVNEPLIGEKLPFWSEVISLNQRCAFCFSQIPFQSTDIAITPDGPVLIEVNTGGSFELPQLASGRGFLNSQVRDFLVSRGLTEFREK